MIHKRESKPSKMVVKAAVDLSNRLYRQKASLTVLSAADTGRVLVVRRFKDGHVGLPCGKVDAGEDLRVAALRELHEETGVTESLLIAPLVFMQSILFEGTSVNIFVGKTETEVEVKPAQGFENETDPFWIEPMELASTESRFQSFNIVAMHNAGLIE